MEEIEKNEYRKVNGGEVLGSVLEQLRVMGSASFSLLFFIIIIYNNHSKYIYKSKEYIKNYIVKI